MPRRLRRVPGARAVPRRRAHPGKLGGSEEGPTPDERAAVAELVGHPAPSVPGFGTAAQRRRSDDRDLRLSASRRGAKVPTGEEAVFEGAVFLRSGLKW